MPTSRKQMWLARGAIISVLALLTVLLSFGVPVSAVKEGTATIYSPSLVMPIVSGGFGILVGVTAVVFWMQPGRFFRLVAAALALLALYALFNAPTGLNHRLVVTPLSFQLRLGSWYAPVDTRVEFASLQYLVVDKAKGGGYELRAITKDGNQASVPICDLLRKALPEILRGAARGNVVIGEGPDGLQIPTALRNE